MFIILHAFFSNNNNLLIIMIGYHFVALDLFKSVITNYHEKYYKLKENKCRFVTAFLPGVEI